MISRFQTLQTDGGANVTFKIEDQVIYAHSWILAQKSPRFEKHFKSSRGGASQHKIVILNTRYILFQQLIQFLYTGNWKVNDQCLIEALKLAYYYQLYNFETHLINRIPPKYYYQAFEFCVTHRYDLLYNFLLDHIIQNLADYIESSEFKNADPNVVATILNLDFVPHGVREIDLYRSFERWMGAACKKTDLSLYKRRSQFDRLIRLIRFPTMSLEEFRACAQNNNGILTSREYEFICKQIKCGEIALWNSKTRLDYIVPIEMNGFDWTTKIETKFSVLMKLRLYGIRFISDKSVISHKIIISTESVKQSKLQVVYEFVYDDLRCMQDYLIVSLGDSIVLKPNYVYVIEFQYMLNGTNVYTNGLASKQPNLKDICVTGPEHLVQISQMSGNLVELFVKL